MKNNRFRSGSFGRGLRRLTALLIVAGCCFAPCLARAEDPSNGCNLDSAHGSIHHVIYVQFDNLHFVRDNPNVPSDLEQMPNLLSFMENNGVLLTNHHTPLISHTANDILTSFTGVYPDQHGVPVPNSFRYFNPNGNLQSWRFFRVLDGAPLRPLHLDPN